MQKRNAEWSGDGSGNILMNCADPCSEPPAVPLLHLVERRRLAPDFGMRMRSDHGGQMIDAAWVRDWQCMGNSQCSPVDTRVVVVRAWML